MSEVYKAIANVMRDLSVEGISKDRKNQQQGYSFRGIDDVYNSLSVVMARHGLMMLPRVLSRECTERATAKGGVLFYSIVEVEFDLVAIDGSKHTIKTFGEAMDSADKSTNKAMSAAYKYAAMQAFCIPTEGDNDADASTHAVSIQYITADQIINLNDMIKHVNADKDGFLNFLKVPSLDMLPSNKYDAAISALKAKEKSNVK